MRGLVLAFSLTLAPAAALASCEANLKVQSRVILFSFSDAMPMSRVDFSPEDEHEHFRRLAHGLAVGQRAFAAVEKYSDESGAPIRGAVALTTAGRIVPVNPSNSYDEVIASVCKGIVAESTCVLWTCEIGRFRSQAAATAWADQFGTVYDKDLLGNVELYERGPMALVIYETCAGAVEPASFVVRVPGGIERTLGDATRPLPGSGGRREHGETVVGRAGTQGARGSPARGRRPARAGSPRAG